MDPHFESIPSIPLFDRCLLAVRLILDVASAVVEDYSISCFDGLCYAYKRFMEIRDLRSDLVRRTRVGDSGELVSLSLIALVPTQCDQHQRSQQQHQRSGQCEVDHKSRPSTSHCRQIITIVI